MASALSVAAIVAGCVAIAVASWVALQFYNALATMEKGDQIPGPKASLRDGNQQDIQSQEGAGGLYGYLERLHSTYGPIVRLWTAPGKLLVSVLDSDLAKLVLMNARDRAPLPLRKESVFNSMVFSAEGEARLRRPFLDYHCHTTLMFKLHPLCMAVAEHVMAAWATAAEAEREVDVKAASRQLVVGVMGAAIYGEAFVRSPLYPELIDLVWRVAAGQEAFCKSPLWFPFWNGRYLAFLRDVARLKVVADELMEMRLRASSEEQEGPASEPTKADIERRAAMMYATEDFITAMLKERTVVGESLYSEEAASTGSMSVVFHSCLSSAAVLSRALVCIAQVEEVQQQIQMELAQVCPVGELPSEESLSHMHYLLATIHEASRLSPVEPSLDRCSLEHDVKVGEHVVPAGATLAIPTRALLRDEKVWGPDPAKFNPERFIKRQRILPSGKRMHTWAQSLVAADSNAKGWRGASLALGSNGGKVPSGAPASAGMTGGTREFDPRMGIEESGHVNRNADCYAFVDPGSGPHFLLFGAGPRACVGRRFALTMLRTLLAALLSRFELQLSPGSGESLELEMGALVLDYRADPKLLLTRR